MRGLGDEEVGVFDARGVEPRAQAPHDLLRELLLAQGDLLRRVTLAPHVGDEQGERDAARDLLRDGL